ncbi:MAG TPA: methyltransferase domain-containing protein [Gaiellaceae bacterium]
MSHDRWAEWLAERRFGGDPAWRTRTLEKLVPVRDRVLDNANLAEGDVVLDIGAGDGLIGFGALERVGERGQVVFSDISEDLLATCRELAAALDVADHCSFVEASAGDLAAIESESVDVVTTRSVLIYLADKLSALKEFGRVLRPGGRISLFEPINKFDCPERPDRFWGYDVSPVQGIADKLLEGYRKLDAGAGTLIDFDERDLLAWTEEAGFAEIHMDYSAEISPSPMLAGMSWDAFLSFSGNPLEPTVEEAAREALTEEERERLYEHLRPLVEKSEGRTRLAKVYLWAIR